jgi:hypothetical protein
MEIAVMDGILLPAKWKSAMMDVYLRLRLQAGYR